MSTYCVSDIHGQYDLFIEGLKKISFNPKVDNIYILGDVCNKGKNSLDVYKYILDNRNSVHLILGNHEWHLIDMLKVWIQIRKHQDLVNVLKIYVENYVTGFEKAVVHLWRLKENHKYLSTDRRKICFEQLKLYRQLCKKHKIENSEILLKFYENGFCVKNLIKEFVKNINFDYKEFLKYLLNCEKIIEIKINDQKWVMYHSEFSEKNNTWKGNQLISKINSTHNSSNINYIFGHNPVPTIIKQIDAGSSINYFNILKVIDSNNNKFFNIDVSNYGICFLKLDDLTEIYVGNKKEKKFKNKIILLKNYCIQDITNDNDSYLRHRYIIYKNHFMYYLAIVPRKEIYHLEKSIYYGEISKLFEGQMIEFKNIKQTDINNILNIFLEKIENK